MADGVYSMFGDFAPIPHLMELCKKYPQLHLYFDDVHGMSWRGKNGTGYVLDILKNLPDNVLLFGTLSKTFGASGATLLCTDNRLREKIKNFGGPLTFSAQLEPASVAAAIASADIHLSPEITRLQCDLSEKIEYFKSLLEKTTLPMIDLNNSPVFFLGTAMPLTAYKMVQRLFNDGFYVNPAIYPAVPIKNTGIRITLSRHNQKEEIKALVEAMEFHFPKALEESANSYSKVKKAFGIPEITPQIETPKNKFFPSDEMKKCPDNYRDDDLRQKVTFSEENEEPKPNLIVQYETSIKKIDKQNWNNLLGKQSTFDWEGLSFLENAFSNTNSPENNWDFHYYVIKDKNEIPILATFFTYGLWKDDMLAPESISLQLEEKRKQNPLYLTSKVLGMGSLFTEGNHCYINKTHPLAEEAIMHLLEHVEIIYHKLGADMLVLRDFEEDQQLNRIFHNQGFLKINMPETCIIQNSKWNSIEEFSETLSSRSRKHFFKEIVPFEKAFDVMIKDQLSNEELEQAYYLYQNVKNNNHAINTFTYPLEVFKQMESNPQWEFILLYLKEDISNPLVGILFCYKNTEHTYVPALIGMDYSYAKEFQLYRQLLFQAIKRARELNLSKIDFGVSATFEKRKLGATVIPKVAYIQARDNFSMELMATLQNEDQTH